MHPDRRSSLERYSKFPVKWFFRRNDSTDAPQPDLVLLDLNLPHKNGDEVLEDPDRRYIPVAVLTSSDTEGDVVRSDRLYANGYLTKPVDPSESL